MNSTSEPRNSTSESAKSKARHTALGCLLLHLSDQRIIVAHSGHHKQKAGVKVNYLDEKKGTVTLVKNTAPVLPMLLEYRKYTEGP
jgi:hypothetical protein